MSESADKAEQSEVTRLLQRLHDSPEVLDRIMALVYDDIRRIAHNQNLAHPGITPQTTELVHEAFLKLFAERVPELHGRLHLMRMTALAVRQLIVDQARARLSQKRGAGVAHLPLDETKLEGLPDEAARVLRVEKALERLERHDAHMAELIVASVYGGYTAAELAEMHDCSPRTVLRQLKRARGWLRLELED